MCKSKRFSISLTCATGPLLIYELATRHQVNNSPFYLRHRMKIAAEFALAAATVCTDSSNWDGNEVIKV